jgi:hypothetical protein
VIIRRRIDALAVHHLDTVATERSILGGYKKRAYTWICFASKISFIPTHKSLSNAKKESQEIAKTPI